MDDGWRDKRTKSSRDGENYSAGFKVARPRSRQRVSEIERFLAKVRNAQLVTGCQMLLRLTLATVHS